MVKFSPILHNRFRFWIDFLSLFYRKKEKQKKLAAAEKYAKIMILSLNKKNSLRSDSFLFLMLQTHNFLTLFLQGAGVTAKNKDSIKNKSLLTCGLVVLWSCWLKKVQQPKALAQWLSSLLFLIELVELVRGGYGDGREKKEFFSNL